jgi:HD-GYP domain-containing protein (c-di-GMP phosphodiesterase class II)
VRRARLRAALDAVRPDGPPDKGSPAAELAKALGVEESAVQKILDAAPRDRGGHPDLVAALADGLGIDEAKVEAALDKLHDGRHAEFAAALAKELGLSADRVEKALEATRPEPPRGP